MARGSFNEDAVTSALLLLPAVVHIEPVGLVARHEDSYYAASSDGIADSTEVTGSSGWRIDKKDYGGREDPSRGNSRNQDPFAVVLTVRSCSQRSSKVLRSSMEFARNYRGCAAGPFASNDTSMCPYQLENCKIMGIT